MLNIDLALDEALYEYGVQKFIKWNPIKYPHVVIFGSTGSGKTYLLKIILGRICLFIPNAELIVCDFKSDMDFEFLSGSENFYRFNECMNGLNKAVEILHNRQNKSDAHHFVMLVFDEWASFINNLDNKKQAEKAKQYLSMLLMLGRSFNIHVLISQQRLDASYFNSSRDNFSVIIGMGKLSKESIEMMFSEYKDFIDRNKDQGRGSLIIGNQFNDIIVPRIQDRSKLETTIIKGVNRH